MLDTKILLSKPNNLLALAVIERTWDFQDRSSERITPSKCFQFCSRLVICLVDFVVENLF